MIPCAATWGRFSTWLNRKWYKKSMSCTRLVILDPYVRLSHFLAEVIDWRFWHDWFHDKVPVLAVSSLLTRLLSVRVDLGGIDAFANGLATVTQRVAAAGGAPAPDRLCAQLRPLHFRWSGSHYWISGSAVSGSPLKQSNPDRRLTP